MFKKLTNIIGLLVILFAFSSSAQAKERLFGYCEDGGRTVTTASIVSTTKVQQSYPSCTITVYNTGTIVLADLYSDDSGTILSNPFTSSGSGAWYFYANNSSYDVRFSNGGIPIPFTKGDQQAFDPKDIIPSVLDFGAKCNGIADDTTSIQNAINTSSGKGLKLSLPGGTCLFTSLSIPNNTGIIGQGTGISILKELDNSSIAGVSLLINSDSMGGNSNLFFEDFTLDGNQENNILSQSSGFASDVDGFYLNNVENVRFNKVQIINTLAKPIFGAGWVNFTVTNSSFSDYNYNTANGSNSAAIELSYNYQVPGVSYNINVSNNIINGVGGDTGGVKLAGTSILPFYKVLVQNNIITVGDCIPNGCLAIELYNNGPTASVGFHDFVVTGNIISGASTTSGTTGNTWGVSAAGAGGYNGTVSDNVIQYMGFFGLELAANNNLTASHNTIKDGAGISVLVTAPGLPSGSVNMVNNNIIGNVIINPTTANETTTSVAGIQFYGENDNTATGIIFSNNTVKITRTNYAVSAIGLWAQANGSSATFANTSILGNIFYGPGSLYDGVDLEPDLTAVISNSLVDSNTFIGLAVGQRLGGIRGVITNNRYTNVTARYAGSIDVSTIFNEYVESSDYTLAWASLSPSYNLKITQSGQYIQTNVGSSQPNIITWNSTNGGNCTIGGVLSTNSRQNKSTDPVPNGWTKTSSGGYTRALYTTLGACRAGFGFGPATGAGPNQPIDDYEFVVEDPDSIGGIVSGGVGIGKLGVPSGSRIKNYLATSSDWTPGTITNGSRNSSTFVLTGCKPGDLVIAGFTLLTNQGATISGSAGTNAATITIANNTGGSLTFGAGTASIGCFGF